MNWADIYGYSYEVSRKRGIRGFRLAFNTLAFLRQFFSMIRNEDISSLGCIIIFQNDPPRCANDARGKKGMDH